MTPVIGVTATLKVDREAVGTGPTNGFARTDMDYVHGVARAGGIPMVLPPVVDEAVIEEMASRLDGIVLGGGSDIDPAHYGEEPVVEIETIIPERDFFELALMDRALELGIPVFGICRGMQLINVKLGGTLYQDIATQYEGAYLRHQQTAPRWHPTHSVRVEEGSVLAGVTGAGRVPVNSYHHQAIKDLAAGLRVVARSSDGVIEAVETGGMSAHWILGVQWHAEAMHARHERQLGLFRALVEAAEERRKRRRPAA
ncbi:gamma-glutamyl-gamma-aminobutyrate hydrolase family protein [Rubrobacter taiwanensis]|uniref:gamma-glutamyl-gamma-aminobutyrate hydrolase family protein n=1 Tax=Rubrobacter taiwanensis TaxID=185139 RepID=UPI001A9CE872|nr:gamma-glutamyl-gamma-aminobutyrate hydrolase family protein [Rubrobacter taiwanensis]